MTAPAPEREKGIRLSDESVLEQAESVLHQWATQLAEADMHYDAAEALRTESAVLKFRCGISEKLKARP